MRLTSEEVEELKKTKPIKLWRFDEPRAADEGAKYTTGGEVYTVLDVRTLRRADVMKLGLWDLLKDQWPAGQMKVWCVTVVKGDKTDHPRLLSANPGAQRADYTDILSKAARKEPEAVSSDVVDKFAEVADAGIVAKQTKRQKKQKIRRQVRRLKKALDE